MMPHLNAETIKKNFADSAVIYERGLGIYQNGAFLLKESDADQRTFLYAVDGSYGDYLTRVRRAEDRIDVSCSCPYPGNGCKHAVAALLDVRDIVRSWKSAVEEPAGGCRWEGGLPDRRRSRAKRVGVVINRGERAAGYVMPDLIGAASDAALGVLRSHGLRVSVVAQQPYPGAPSGIILRQSPAAGFQVTSDQPISLEVSR